MPISLDNVGSSEPFEPRRVEEILERLASGRVGESEFAAGARKESGAYAAAYSWIYEKLLANRERRESEEGRGTRSLSERETERLGRANADWLLSLERLGLLTPEDVDLIVERLKDFPEDEEILEEDLNYMLLAAIFEIDQSTPAGSRTMLYLSDAIN
jgi:uncharacterized protein Smg (DUF494 family)